MRQEKSMWLGPGEDMLLLVGRVDHWQAMWGQSTEHRETQEVRVMESLVYRYQEEVSELPPRQCPE